MLPELRSWYADQYNVRSKAEFEAGYDRTCPLCPEDWHNMPHREKHCPSMNAGFTSGVQRLGKVDAARILARALARGRGDTASATVVDVCSVAATLDRQELPGCLDACEYYFEWFPDDADCEVAFAQHVLTEHDARGRK